MHRPLFFIIAGEPSGDRLGAALMRALKWETGGPVSFKGIGGPAMRAEGLKSPFDINDLSVMGFSEVIPKIPLLLQRIRETVEAVEAADPDAVVTIDAQDFSKRVLKRLKQRGNRAALIQYVAPTVWAWRPGRAAKLAKIADHLMTILPFEPPYFEKHGLSAEYVGHPLVERMEQAEDPERIRRQLQIPQGAPVLALLLGSRAGEVSRLAAPFGEAAARIKALRPDLEVVVPLAAPVAEQALAAAAEWPFRARFLDPRKRDFNSGEARKFGALRLADAAIAASGTVSLELAACGTPAVIGYKTSRLNAFILRRLIRTDTATLTNLISETRATPEFFQEDCTAGPLAVAAAELLKPDSPARLAQIEAQAKASEIMGGMNNPPSRRAARSALAALARKQADQ